MISDISVVARSPEDVMSDTARQYLEEEDNESDEDESSEEGKEADSLPSYEVPKEPHSKALHDPSGKVGGAQQLTASGRTTRSSKRGHAEAETSAEKQPKQPKQIASKPRKAVVPRIKVTVPVGSM